jgi:hypothetical protein
VKILKTLIATALLVAVLPSAALASKTQESMFQDDPLLVFGSNDVMEKTLSRLASVGVDRLRVSVFWNVVAPAAEQPTKPAGFDAADPASYPAASWDRYDRLIRAAQARGIGVNLNITSPIPRWAASVSPRADLQDTFGPIPGEFGQFVRAVATRYGGAYGGLPRVDYWSIYNEPNQAGWLTPQWNTDPRDPKAFVEVAPHTYRALVAAAWVALQETGHAKDTVLIGETAPKGQQTDRGLSESLDVLRFVRSMYCLDDNLQFFRGTSAEVRGCPQNDPAGFVANNPALFHATGFAHHPYELLLAPTRRSRWADWVTIANLGDLTRELRRIYQRYGVATQDTRGVPLYLTEFGYQTPPDPLAPSFARQAAWSNQSEYIAYRNPLVRSFSQFLLNDDAPVPGIDPQKDPRAAWVTFQSGLRSNRGRNKPSFKAYVTPIHVTQTRIRRGRGTTVFALLRPASPAAPAAARIEFRRKGAKRWRTLARRTARAPRHYVQTRLRIPSSGSVRVRWKHGTKQLTSRSVRVTVRR